MSWLNAPFVSKITAASQISGVWTYSWAEQILDPNGSGYVAVSGGRGGTSTICQAYEINNQQVAVNQLVFMRLRGSQMGGDIYEFEIQTPYTWPGFTLTNSSGTPRH